MAVLRCIAAQAAHRRQADTNSGESSRMVELAVEDDEAGGGEDMLRLAASGSAATGAAAAAAGSTPAVPLPPAAFAAMATAGDEPLVDDDVDGRMRSLRFTSACMSDCRLEGCALGLAAKSIALVSNSETSRCSSASAG